MPRKKPKRHQGAAQWSEGYENCCVFAGPDALIRPIPGGPVCRPYKREGRDLPPHPSGLRPAPLPLLAFGHFPLIGGIVLPPGGRLAGGSRPRPYGEFGNGPFFFVGAGHWPARRRATAIPEPTLIRLAYARHLLPGREKAFGRLIDAPTADTEAVSFSRRGRSQTGPRAATWGRPYGSQKTFSGLGR